MTYAWSCSPSPPGRGGRGERSANFGETGDVRREMISLSDWFYLYASGKK